MGDEDAEPEGAVEIFGVLRLPLASGTASGYVGVRHVKKSKKRPWQAWVHIKGEKRRCLGSFRSPQEGAVARARAVSCGPETLPSPRRQAARNSGAAAYSLFSPRISLPTVTVLNALRLTRVVCCAQFSNDQLMLERLSPHAVGRTFGRSLSPPATQPCSTAALCLRTLLAFIAHHIQRAACRLPGGCCQANPCL